MTNETEQTTERYKKVAAFNPAVRAGLLARQLMQMDLNRPYDASLTHSERSNYASNIVYMITVLRKCDGLDLDLISGMLGGIDVEDLEVKALTVSQGISVPEAEEMIFSNTMEGRHQ